MTGERTGTYCTFAFTTASAGDRNCRDKQELFFQKSLEALNQTGVSIHQGTVEYFTTAAPCLESYVVPNTLFVEKGSATQSLSPPGSLDCVYGE